MSAAFRVDYCDGPTGIGWYWWDEEYPEDNGPFATYEECVDSATDQHGDEFALSLNAHTARISGLETQLAERTRERDLAETCASALQATLDMAVQERERLREQLEAERATSHGLRLLNGTNDAVYVQLIRERDEAIARAEERNGQCKTNADALTRVAKEARAESARLREARLKALESAVDNLSDPVIGRRRMFADEALAIIERVDAEFAKGEK